VVVTAVVAAAGVVMAAVVAIETRSDLCDDAAFLTPVSSSVNEDEGLTVALGTEPRLETK